MSQRIELTREDLARRARVGFLIHGIVYLAVNAGLATLNLFRNPDNPWFLWVLGGWGAGLALHAALIFHPGLFQRVLDRRMERLQRRISRRAAS